MEGSRGYGCGSNMIAMLENSNNSFWVPSPSPSFHETMVNFDLECQQGMRASIKRDYDDDDDDDDDTGGEELEITRPRPRPRPEKKRRLSPEQIELLEKSFELENKLEPERKMELAKELGLQPKQVAIWFQNRRARYKTKQLEKEYGSLKDSYDLLMFDFDSLSKERDDLQNQVNELSKKLKKIDEAKHITPIDLLHSDEEMPKSEFREMSKTGLVIVPSATNKQLAEDANSAKSDILDSESPHSSLMEDPTDPLYDFSKDEKEHLAMSDRPLLPVYNNFLKVEDNSEFYDPNPTSCNFSLVDDPPFWSMLD